jgi:hypothetical protein
MKKDNFPIFNFLWKALGFISRRKGLSVLMVGLLAFFGCEIVGLVIGMPLPRVHDEFSNLLAADTFSHGHLTNPTHPMWRHFESFHVLQQPTYMSKYFPAEGLILALGKVIFGHPVFGVYLSMALMCAAICWMLQAWVPSRWALIGGLIVLLHPYIGITSNWAQSYFGSAIAAFGGALFFGGFRRIIRKPNIIDSMIMALGAAILANSRPFEGLIVILPALGVLFLWTFLKFRNVVFPVIIRNVILPFLIIIGSVLIAMGYYNQCITGNAFSAPYNKYETTYSNSPNFVWEKIRPQPEFSNKTMAVFNEEYCLKNHHDHLKFTTRLLEIRKNISFVFVSNPFYNIPLFCSLLLLISGERWMMFIYFNVIVFWVLTTLSFWSSTYYTSVLVGLYAIMLTQGLRVLSFFRIQRRKRPGRLLVISFLYIALLLCVQNVKSSTPVYVYRWAEVRQGIINNLQKTNKKHLIIVRYGQAHNFLDEWVYNEADIDHASVVWAHEMQNVQDQELIEYFKDRQAWLLDIKEYDRMWSFSLNPVNGAFPVVKNEQKE